MRRQRRTIGWRNTVVQAGTFAVCGVLPILLYVGLLRIAQQDGFPAWDFHHELYPQAKLMVSGDNPYPTADVEPRVGTNLVWPPAAAFLISPFTLLAPVTADWIFAIVGLGCFAGALWLVGVRDWRVYGVSALWPPVYIEIGLSHLTPAIALLIAAAWRTRDARYTSGLLIGLAIAIKLFAWPLGLWLATRGKWRAAVLATVVPLASMLLVLPYAGLNEYVEALVDVGKAFDGDSYTVFGGVVQAGGSEALARVLNIVVVVALVLATVRYRSFSLAVAAALAASPIVWLDYFALAAVPLALARPRLSPIWFVPLATVGLEGAGLAIGDTLGTVRALGAVSIVLAVAFRGELEAAGRMPRAGEPAAPCPQPSGRPGAARDRVFE